MSAEVVMVTHKIFQSISHCTIVDGMCQRNVIWVKFFSRYYSVLVDCQIENCELVFIAFLCKFCKHAFDPPILTWKIHFRFVPCLGNEWIRFENKSIIIMIIMRWTVIMLKPPTSLQKIIIIIFSLGPNMNSQPTQRLHTFKCIELLW